MRSILDNKPLTGEQTDDEDFASSESDVSDNEDDTGVPKPGSALVDPIDCYSDGESAGDGDSDDSGTDNDADEVLSSSQFSQLLPAPNTKKPAVQLPAELTVSNFLLFCRHLILIIPSLCAEQNTRCSRIRREAVGATTVGGRSGGCRLRRFIGAVVQ